MRIAEIDDIGLIKETVRNLGCFSVLPVNSVKEELKNGHFKKLSTPLDQVECIVSALYKPQFQSERFIRHLDQISVNSLW